MLVTNDILPTYQKVRHTTVVSKISNNSRCEIYFDSVILPYKLLSALIVS